jgi:3alpha(or 20beta)-hydroxysteroid dehydrogenase
VNRVTGKTAIVTGAASGLGAAQARELVAEGANVVLADVQDDAGSALAEDLGGRARFTHLDVTDPDGWDSVVADAAARFGPVDVLVNTAGIVRRAALRDHSLEDFRAVIEVNLVGAFNGMKAVIPGMIAHGGGSIINMSSIAGIKASPMVPGYVASKWGLRGLTKSAALDLGGYNIRVNSVHPGMHRTPMTAASPHNTDVIALHRTGRPEELAHLIVFLASDESAFITGSEFIHDGGETAGTALPPTAAG